MAAKTKQIVPATDSFVVEAQAMLAVVEFAIEIGFMDIQVKGDALSVITSVNCEQARDVRIFHQQVCLSGIPRLFILVLGEFPLIIKTELLIYLSTP